MAKIGPPPESAGNQPSALYSVSLSCQDIIRDHCTAKRDVPSFFSSVPRLSCWREADGFRDYTYRSNANMDLYSSS
jgi:hypothetical protein